MGDVYLAEHRMLKRPCAIKLIRREQSSDAHTLARFEREVRATARLSHWNTVLIFDYGRNDDGVFYYAMEYLPGLSLDNLVRRYGPMPPARVIYLLRQACDALHEAHEAGLVHRDIKPANLFAAYRGGHHDVAKLLDFGLVKTLQGGDGIQLSREDTIAGSPLYIAPEQVVYNQPPDRRADIYSIGAVAYYLLTGHPPFLGSSAMEVMVSHMRDPVVSPTQVRPEVPSDLAEVVLRLPGQAADRSLPGYAEPGRGPGRLCRRVGLVARARRGLVAGPCGRLAARARGGWCSDRGGKSPVGRARGIVVRRIGLVAPDGRGPPPDVTRVPALAQPETTRRDATDFELSRAGRRAREPRLDDRATGHDGPPGVRLRRRRRDRPGPGAADPPGGAGAVAASSSDARIDRLPPGADSGGGRAGGDPPAGRLGADPAASRRADALRLRRDLAVGPVPHDDLAGGPARAGRRAGRAGPADRIRPETPGALAQPDRAGRARLRRQRDERGIHRLPARRAPARLARSAPTGSPVWSASRPDR